MMFPRCRMKEIHECSWCPGIIRDGVTDFLSFFAAFSGIRRKAYERIARMFPESGAVRIVELCGGSGFGALHMLRSFRTVSPGREISAEITDINANGNWPQVVKMSGGALSADEIDAESALERKEGLFVMFAALHHFSPSEIASLVKTAAANGRDAVLVDYFRRGRPVDLFPLFAGPALMFVSAPLVFPFSWKRVLLTWAVPVLPLTLFLDTAISMLRSYTCCELRKIVDSADLPAGAKAEVFELTDAGGVIKMPTVVIRAGIYGPEGRGRKKKGTEK